MIKLFILTYIKNNNYNIYIGNVKIYTIFSGWITSTFTSMYLLSKTDKDVSDKYNDYLIQY